MATCQNEVEVISMETKVHRLMENISCSFCHSPFTEARKLSCHHHCCTRCIEARASNSSAGRGIKCKKCQERRQVSPEEIDTLPISKCTVKTQQLVDAIANKKRSGSLSPCELCTSPTAAPSTSYCYDCSQTLCSFCDEVHDRLKPFASHTVIPAAKMITPAPPTKPRPPRDRRACSKHKIVTDFYCHSCARAVCSECLMDEHKQHQFEDILVATDTARRQVADAKLGMTEIESSLTDAKQKLEKNVEAVKKQRKETEDFINQSFDLVLKPFERYRSNLLKSLENRISGEITEIRNREASLLQAKNQLQEFMDLIDAKLSTNGPQCTIRDWEAILEESKEKEGYCRDKVQAADTPEHVFDPLLIYKNSSARIIGAIGDSLKSADPVMCTLSGEGSKNAKVGEEAEFTLEARQSNDAPCQALQYVEVELTCMSDDSKCDVTVQLVKGSLYKMTYKPKLQGQHRLKVKINDKPILGNPFQVMVKRPILKRRKPRLIIEGVNKIADMAIHHRDGSIMATQPNEGTVIKVDKKGKYVQTLFTGLDRPHGIATNASGALFLSLNKKCRVLKYDRHRSLVKTTGCKDTTLGHFNKPGRMAVTPRGDLVVCDVKNSRIQVFDEDLDYTRWYSVSQPAGVASTSDGNFYVSENGRGCFSKIYDANKMGIARMPGDLSDPQGVHVDDDYVYVVERGKSQISVFTHEGELVTGLGKGLLKEPGAVVGDRDGYLYVCDNKLESICVF